MRQRHEEISLIAYQRWQSRGCPDDSADEDWRAAELEVDGEPTTRSIPHDAAGLDGRLEDTFPASDPPASQLADEPPSNAEDKWVNSQHDLPVDVKDLSAAK